MSLDTEIRPLHRETLEELLNGRQSVAQEPGFSTRRKAPRWLFSWPVELWVPDGNGREAYALATCRNLSTGGVGVISDDALPVGCVLPVAIHQPEMSFHGRAVVRHCRKAEEGYHAGLEFVFD